MRAIADDELPLSVEFAEEMDYCVGCLACQTACPAGVDYAQLFETARATNEQTKLLNSPMRQFYRWLGMRLVFTRPWLLRLVGRFVAIYQKPLLRKSIRRFGLLYLAPPRLRKLEPQSPPIDLPFSDARIKKIEKPKGLPQARVALLTGCIQDIVYARVNRATVDVLQAIGCEVVTPRSQPCCGSLHGHNGDLETARLLARRSLDQFREGGPHPLSTIDAVISNAGGCGSHLRHYAHLLKDDPSYVTQAKEWDAKLKDVQEYIVDCGESRVVPDHSEGNRKPLRVTYDASCHLHHGQKVVTQPVELLKSLPGVEFVPLNEADWCCGAAGVYTITQPEQANILLQRKLANLRSAKIDILATANPGCMHQLTMACSADKELSHVRIVHPLELIAEKLKAVQ